MAHWKDGKLDLGALGHLEVWEWSVHQWQWEWMLPTGLMNTGKDFVSPGAAKRAAESWLRRALKQASKRLEG